MVLSGYNRDARLTGNTFYLLGGSAVVLWGHETNGDGTDGNQPRRTTVSENFCHGQPASKLRRPRLRSTGIIVSRVAARRDWDLPEAIIMLLSRRLGTVHRHEQSLLQRPARHGAPHLSTFYAITFTRAVHPGVAATGIRRVLPCMSSVRDRHSLTAAFVRSQVNFVSGIGAHPQPGPCGLLVRIGLLLLTAVGRRMTRSAGGTISATT